LFHGRGVVGTRSERKRRDQREEMQKKNRTQQGRNGRRENVMNCGKAPVGGREAEWGGKSKMNGVLRSRIWIYQDRECRGGLKDEPSNVHWTRKAMLQSGAVLALGKNTSAP